MVFAYSKMRQVTALNVEMISLFYLLHLFEVSTLRMLSVCFALMRVRFMNCENVSFGSKNKFQKFLGVLLLVVIDCLNLSYRVAIFRWVWCKKCNTL